VTVKTYDPGQVVVAVGGNILSGFAEDGLVEVERAEASFVLHVGADGEVTRSRNRNRSGTVKVKLIRTSSSNDVLAGLLRADELFGTGVFPISVKDLLGTTIHFGQSAWVERPPTDTFDKEANEREWTISVGDLDMNPGGNIISG
jgi:hypothetical protein